MEQQAKPETGKALAQHVSSFWRGIKKTSVTVNETPISYLEAGAGEAIILLHGFAGAKTHWRSFMVGLKDSVHVIALEIPGFNLQPSTLNTSYSLRYFSNWLNLFIETLPAKKVHLVGFSAGACFAAYYATAFADRVQSLTFISFPNIYIDENSKYKNIFDECLYSDVCKPKDMATLWEAFFYDPPNVPTIFYSAWYKAYAKTKPALLRLVRDLSDSTTILFPRLSTINCPVLAIRGEADSNSSSKMNGYLDRAISKFHCVEIPKASHLCYIERQKETLFHIKNFIGQHAENDVKAVF